MPTGEDRPQRQAESAVEASIAALIERTLSGDEAAARILFDRHQSHVLRVIRGKYLPLDSTLRRDLDSDDLVQEGWLVVIRELHDGKSFATHGEFQRFFLAVTANEFKQYYRARVLAVKRSVTREEPLDRAGGEQTARGLGPALQAAEVDECAVLLAKLSSPQRAILSAIGDGFSQADAAHQLGISLRSVKRLLLRAREQLGSQSGGK